MQIPIRNYFKIYLFLFIFLLIAFSQVSCRPSRKRSRIIVAGAGKITSLDPAQASTFHALQLISALGDTLYRLDKSGNLEPRLAIAQPVVSNNGLTISIPLREDVLFHDGTKFNAEAMAFSLKRFQRIGTLNYILGDKIAGIEASEEFTLKLKLTRKSTSLNGLLTSINLTPISPNAYINHRNKFLNTDFIGTGPYQIKSFRSQHQRLEPFKFYWEGSIRNKGIDFINLSNSTSLFSAVRTGEVDVLLSTSIEEDHRIELRKMTLKGILNEGSGKPLEIGYITLNTKSEPLNIPRIRKAISYSINRSLISKRVSYGLREPLRSLVPKAIKENDFSPWPKYNPIKAKDLFTKAGYCKGKKLNLSFTFRSNVPADKLLALTWQAQTNRDLSDCLLVKPNGIESTTIYRQLGEGAFQAVMLDWRGAYPDPEAYLAPLLSCIKINKNICEKGEAAISGSFWASSVMEKALKEADKIGGSKRKIKLEMVEQIAADAGAYIPIWLEKPRAWSQRYISSPEFDGNGNLLLNRLKNIEQ